MITVGSYRCCLMNSPLSMSDPSTVKSRLMSASQLVVSRARKGCLPLASAAASSVSTPLSKCLATSLALATPSSHSTHTRSSIIPAASLQPSVSSIVYKPSITTTRCCGRIGKGEGVGSLRAWEKVGKGMEGGGGE